jgi:hypothetical protein
MIQGSEDFCFALKARQAIGIRRQRWREDLDGDLTLQLRVCRSIHLAHSTRAKGRDDLVRAEASAGSKGQTLIIWAESAGTGGSIGSLDNRLIG